MMSRRLVGAFARVCGLVGPLRGQVSCEGTSKMETCPGNYDLSPPPLPPQVLNSTKPQSTVASAKFTLPVRNHHLLLMCSICINIPPSLSPPPPPFLPPLLSTFFFFPLSLLFFFLLSLSSFSFLPSFLPSSPPPSFPYLPLPPHRMTPTSYIV